MPRAINAGVQVSGLKELRRDLRRVDAALPQELRATNRRVGEQIVLPAARQRAGSTFRNVAGGTFHAGAALAGTIRILSQQTAAQIAMGGARFPFAGGAEWGSTGKNPRARQFPLRGSNRGFILFPVVRERQEEIRKAYAEALDGLLEQAGLS